MLSAFAHVIRLLYCAGGEPCLSAMDGSGQMPNRDIGDSGELIPITVRRVPSNDTSAQGAPVGPYSPAETCASCGHQSFYHGAGAPMCSFTVPEHESCACQNLRFSQEGREYRMPEAIRLRNARLALASAQSEFEAAVAAYALAEKAEVGGA